MTKVDRKKFIIISFLSVILIILASIVYVTKFINSKYNSVPSSISLKVDFPIFYPKSAKQAKVDESSLKYDKKMGQVSYVVNYQHRTITFAEQASPESFSADPGFYTSFVRKLGSYYNFDSLNGRVDLTVPQQVGTETAIMNAKGTLLFAKSSGDLSQYSWRLLFNSLYYTRP